MNRYFSAKVLSNTRLNSNNLVLTIQPLEQTLKPTPGQFYMIEVGGSYDPLLKRPFSYLRMTQDGIQFFYAVRGKGTALMRDFEPGRILRMIGPLGKGYPKPRRRDTPVLVAGGTGIVPVFSLAEHLSRKAYMVYGARCREDMVLIDELKGLKQGDIVCIDCTEDGSCGLKGTAIDALNELFGADLSGVASPVLYACGPKPMLKALSRIAKDRGLRGYVSLEERMACGFGACLGCAVKTIRGNERVCKEGPVFPIEEIVWTYESL
ncbi:MAG: dihydroorotate dehydrogenase electron transfer subunit [Nitrospirota bacterium]